MLEVFDFCVSARIDKPLLPSVAPADQVGRRAILATDFKNFSITVRFVDLVSLNDEPISDTGEHEHSS